MLSVGLDVHARSSVFHVLDASGHTVATGRVRGTIDNVLPALRQIKQKAREPLGVCYEASCGYGHVFETLRQVADRVVPAHPGKLRLIFSSRRKNDRQDAKHLAMLLKLDAVPTVYVPEIDVRDWRRLINHREAMLRERVRVKNRIRALLRGLGVQAPKSLWTRKGRAWLAAVALPTSGARLSLDVMLIGLDSDNTQLARIEKALDAIGRKHPGVQLLRTIPGVGMRTAEAVMAWIDRPERFGRVRTIGSYFGVVPSQDQSADRNRLGHITKQGPSVVRRLLTEASWQSVRHSAKARRYFERIHRGDPDRRKIALVAVGHYLLRTMLSMLKTGAVWSESA